MTEDVPNQSPRWGPTLKLIVGLGLAALIVLLIVRFQNILGPLLLAFVIAYMLHPMAKWVHQHTPLSWRVSVAVVFLCVIIFVASMFTVLGIAVAEQTQNLFNFLDRFVRDLPKLVDSLTTQVYFFGPFQLDLRQYDFNVLLGDLVGALQPLVSRAGSLVSSIATGTASLIGWGSFVFLVAYFIASDASTMSFDQIATVEIPGYDADIRRLGRRLGRIWDGFLRGQAFIFISIIFSYGILLTILGVRNALALAIIAGLARFVPYVGQFITSLLIGLVCLFMPENLFNMVPFYYMLLVVGLAVLMDQAYDTFIVPSLYGAAMGVHPAAVLVAAIIGGSLMGIIGLIVAAPVLATFLLIVRYIIRKLLDLDPWPHGDADELQSFEIPGISQLANWGKALANKIKTWRKIKK